MAADLGLGILQVMASFEFLEDDQNDSNGQARFTVFGVGGAGGNAVQHMLESDIQGVKFVCANTDKQALDRMNADFKAFHASGRTMAEAYVRDGIEAGPAR